jgi:hypothetical protein
MAIFNEIGIGRWNRFIQKLTDMKGGPPARQLSSEIAFYHEIFGGVENRFLESWTRWSISTGNLAAVVGHTSGVRFRNPAGSNVIAVFEKISVGNTSAASSATQFNLQRDQASTDLASGLPGKAMDLRQGVVSASTLVVSSGNDDISGGNMGFYQYPLQSATIDIILFDHHEFNLLPGETLHISSTTANITFGAVNAFWRERLLEPAERF